MTPPPLSTGTGTEVEDAGVDVAGGADSTGTGTEVEDAGVEVAGGADAVAVPGLHQVMFADTSHRRILLISSPCHSTSVSSAPAVSIGEKVLCD